MASTTAAYGEALLPRPPTPEEPPGAASGGEGAGLVSGSDGADDAKDYGTLLPPTKHASTASNRDISEMPVSWEDWSGPWWLLLYTASEVGSILFALLCMLFMVWMKEQFCMDCSMPGINMWEQCFCEYTKSYVRLFPLIALVVALAVASRALLRRHFFYQMLKHRVVVRLQSKRPLQDWLFWVLILCLVQVLCHFILDKAVRTRNQKVSASCWAEGRKYENCCNTAKFGDEGDKACWQGLHFIDYSSCCITEDAIQREKTLPPGQAMHLRESFNRFVQISYTDAKMFNLYFCAPAICFMAFLWTSYDVEQTLLPLSKFMEGDAEQARERLTSTSVINEGDAHRAVKTGLPVKDDDDGYQLHDICRRLAEHAEQLEQARKALDDETRCPACGAILLAGGGECARCADRAEAPMDSALTPTAGRKPYVEMVERIDFTKSWWIAELMIDRQLEDTESRQFRHVWYLYSVISLLVTAMVTYCFIWSMYHHVQKAAEAWEHEQFCVLRLFCACFAEFLHLCVAVNVGTDFVLQGWNPLQKAAEHKVDKARSKARERRSA